MRIAREKQLADAKAKHQAFKRDQIFQEQASVENSRENHQPCRPVRKRGTSCATLGSSNWTSSFRKNDIETETTGFEILKMWKLTSAAVQVCETRETREDMSVEGLRRPAAPGEYVSGCLKILKGVSDKNMILKAFDDVLPS